MDKYGENPIEKCHKEWETAREKGLTKSPERTESFQLSSGVPVKPLYSPLDTRNEDFLEDIGFPGQYPYTRGVYANGYRTQLWNIQQVSGYGLADDTNVRLKKLRAQGQAGTFDKDAINVVFDLPTHYGYDSDAPEAAGEVGRLGVAINTVDDMEMMLDGYNPETTFISFIINHPAIVLLSMYIAHAEKIGIGPSRLAGVMQNDPLSTFAGSKSYIFPPAPSIKLTTDIFSFCVKNMPKWNLNGVVGYCFREKGSTAVQEVAFAIANAMAYIESGIRAGLEVDDFVPRFSFFFSVHNNLFEEVAKLRAARRLWARIIKEKYGSGNPRSLMMRYHLQTAGSSLTAQQPVNNVVRTTVQALAGILSGTQGLHTNSMDEALALPTEDSVKLALRTQQILAYESGITDTVDPLGGSYYVESLTDEIETKVSDYIQKIGAFGENMLDAVIAAVEQGFYHKELAAASYDYQSKIENGSNVIVGVNKFVEEEATDFELFEADPSARERQTARLQEIKSNRSNTDVNHALDLLAGAAEKDENLFPFVLEAVRHRATLGEIVKVLVDVYGQYQDYNIF